MREASVCHTMLLRDRRIYDPNHQGAKMDISIINAVIAFAIIAVIIIAIVVILKKGKKITSILPAKSHPVGEAHK